MSETSGITRKITQLCAAFRRLGVDVVVAYYDGSGDEGQIEWQRYYEVPGESEDTIIQEVARIIINCNYTGDQYNLVIPTSIRRVELEPESHYAEVDGWQSDSVLIESATEQVIYSAIPEEGWENNLGAFGTFFLNVRAQKVTFKHNTRVQNLEYLEVDLAGDPEITP